MKKVKGVIASVLVVTMVFSLTDFAAGDKEVEKSYHAGRNGYYISYNEKDRFLPYTSAMT